MYMYPLLFLVLLYMARVNTAYNPRLLCKRYIRIKNTRLARLLIYQSDVIRSSRKNRKADRNKLTVAGLVFYTLSMLVLLASIALLFWVEKRPSEPFEIDTRTIYLFASNLNEKIVALMAMALLGLEVSFHFINTYSYSIEQADIKAKKPTKILSIVLTCLFLAYNIYIFAELIICFVP